MTIFAKDSEWHLGWRIAGASALANATGISLLFYTFNMFIVPMSQEIGMTRSQSGTVQALVITAALGAPVIGRLADCGGFHLVFLICTAVMAAVELGLAYWGNGFGAFVLGTAVIGFIGGGSSSVLLTRPINAHFRRYRGLALGLVGVGISLTTIFVPPWLQGVIATDGWRQGYVVLAGIAVLIGLPLTMLLMPRSASTRGSAQAQGKADHSYLRERDFWLMTLANAFAAIATSGAISQLSPMLQDKGLSAADAALGLSTFAVGQFIGKLGGGILLDRIEPRLVATVLTALPALAFIVFLGTDHGAFVPLLMATALLGLLQGADVSIFAFFVARRFGVERYGTIFGALHGLGWIGTALGVIGFGVSFDLAHGYWLAQLISIGLLLLAAMLLPLVRLPAAVQIKSAKTDRSALTTAKPPA